MSTEPAIRKDESFSADPLGILRADHRRIEWCFDRYGKADDVVESIALVQELVEAVHLHLDIEEAVFYPAYLHAMGDRVRHRRWRGEHSAERKLLASIAYADPGAEALEHSLAALARRLLPHSREEESEFGAYTEMIRSGVDLHTLSRRLSHYRDSSLATLPVRGQ